MSSGGSSRFVVTSSKMYDDLEFEDQLDYEPEDQYEPIEGTTVETNSENNNFGINFPFQKEYQNHVDLEQEPLQDPYILSNSYKDRTTPKFLPSESEDENSSPNDRLPSENSFANFGDVDNSLSPKCASLISWRSSTMAQNSLPDSFTSFSNLHKVYDNSMVPSFIDSSSDDEDFDNQSFSIDGGVVDRLTPVERCHDVGQNESSQVISCSKESKNAASVMGCNSALVGKETFGPFDEMIPGNVTSSGNISSTDKREKSGSPNKNLKSLKKVIIQDEKILSYPKNITVTTPAEKIDCKNDRNLTVCDRVIRSAVYKSNQVPRNPQKRGVAPGSSIPPPMPINISISFSTQSASRTIQPAPLAECHDRITEKLDESSFSNYVRNVENNCASSSTTLDSSDFVLLEEQRRRRFKRPWKPVDSGDVRVVKVSSKDTVISWDSGEPTFKRPHLDSCSGSSQQSGSFKVPLRRPPSRRITIEASKMDALKPDDEVPPKPEDDLISIFAETSILEPEEHRHDDFADDKDALEKRDLVEKWLETNHDPDTDTDYETNNVIGSSPTTSGTTIVSEPPPTNVAQKKTLLPPRVFRGLCFYYFFMLNGRQCSRSSCSHIHDLSFLPPALNNLHEESEQTVLEAYNYARGHPPFYVTMLPKFCQTFAIKNMSSQLTSVVEHIFDKELLKVASFSRVSSLSKVIECMATAKVLSFFDCAQDVLSECLSRVPELGNVMTEVFMTRLNLVSYWPLIKEIIIAQKLSKDVGIQLLYSLCKTTVDKNRANTIYKSLLRLKFLEFNEIPQEIVYYFKKTSATELSPIKKSSPEVITYSVATHSTPSSDTAGTIPAPRFAVQFGAGTPENNRIFAQAQFPSLGMPHFDKRQFPETNFGNMSRDLVDFGSLSRATGDNGFDRTMGNFGNAYRAGVPEDLDSFTRSKEVDGPGYSTRGREESNFGNMRQPWDEENFERSMEATEEGVNIARGGSGLNRTGRERTFGNLESPIRTRREGNFSSPSLDQTNFESLNHLHLDLNRSRMEERRPTFNFESPSRARNETISVSPRVSEDHGKRSLHNIGFDSPNQMHLDLKRSRMEERRPTFNFESPSRARNETISVSPRVNEDHGKRSLQFSFDSPNQMHLDLNESRMEERRPTTDVFDSLRLNVDQPNAFSRSRRTGMKIMERRDSRERPAPSFSNHEPHLDIDERMYRARRNAVDSDSDSGTARLFSDPDNDDLSENEFHPKPTQKIYSTVNVSKFVSKRYIDKGLYYDPIKDYVDKGSSRSTRLSSGEGVVSSSSDAKKPCPKRPEHPKFGEMSYYPNYEFNVSLHNFYLGKLENVDINEDDVLMLNDVVKLGDGETFLKLLWKYKSHKTIQNFITMTLAHFKGMNQMAANRYETLLCSIEGNNPNFYGNTVIRVCLEVITMNLLFDYDQRMRYKEAQKLLQRFLDWDSLISSRLFFHSKVVSPIRRILFIAKLLCSTKPEWTYEILVAQKLHLLDSTDKWPYLIAAGADVIEGDLKYRNEVIKAFLKEGYRKNMSPFTQLYLTVFTGKLNIYGFHEDLSTYFDDMVVDLINDNSMVYLKPIQAKIDVFARKMQTETLRAYVCCMYPCLSKPDVFKLYEKCAQRGIYQSLVKQNKLETEVHIKTNVLDLEVEMIILYYFYKLAEIGTAQEDLKFVIKLPGGFTSNRLDILNSYSSVKTIQNIVKETLLKFCEIESILKSPNEILVQKDSLMNYLTA